MNAAAVPSPTTREALLDAGIKLFGQHGFAATSTRALAEAAGANIAAIAYHFGSKEGLREACGREAARRLAEDVVGGAVAGLDQALDAGMSAEQAQARLVMLVDILVPALVGRADLDPVVRFVLREQTEMSSAFASVHDAFIAPTHTRLCRLWAAATGEPSDSTQARLSTLTLLAQIIYFRIARNVALKRLGWTTIGSNEAGEIAATVKRNLIAALAAARETSSTAARKAKK